MEQIRKISDWINENSIDIIENIQYESVEVYEFLKNEFKNSDVTKNFLFQFLYRSYYRLDNAGLTNDFKTDYFKILQELRNEEGIKLDEIIKRLYNFKNLKQQKSLQFSFATKLANTINNKTPIYDSQVCKMFAFSRPYQTDYNKKLDRYFEQLEVISNSYERMLEFGLLDRTIEKFDAKFSNKVSDLNKLDFIFWSSGKILSKKKKEEKEESSIRSNWNDVLRLREENLNRKEICQNLFITDNQLEDLEIEYNRITGN